VIEFALLPNQDAPGSQENLQKDWIWRSLLMASKLYEQDYYAWTKEQAAKLRAGRVTEIDLEDLAEEIESMGRSEWYELVNRLAVLLAHLLKWRCQSLPHPTRLCSTFCVCQCFLSESSFADR